MPMVTPTIKRGTGAVLARLEQLASPRIRDELEPRYGVTTTKAFGVPVSALIKLSRELGPNHDLALALWDTGWYEARLLASMIDEPHRVSGAQMDRWAADFDNWGVCDTVCFKLFDRVASKVAFKKVAQWSRSPEEFTRRAAFALLACLALHDKAAADGAFERCIPLAEAGANDERNFVMKAVSWALRAMGRHRAGLHAACTAAAKRLAARAERAPRWVGKDVLRDLSSPAVKRKFKAKTVRAVRKRA